MTELTREYCDLVMDEWREPQRSSAPCLESAVTPLSGQGLPDTYMELFEANERWFHEHRQHLLTQYLHAGYVAVWRCIPIIVGASFMAVAKECDALVGSDPVYIGRLSEEADEEVFSSPEF